MQTLFFVRIPKIVAKRGSQRFFADMKDGFVLIYKIRGLRFLFLCAAALDLFAVMTAESVPVALLIPASFAATFLFFIPMLFSRDLKRCVQFDP